VDVSSGVEGDIKGRKNHMKMKKFIQKAKHSFLKNA
jgi:phosphoribosylanthranilate isomerase